MRTEAEAQRERQGSQKPAPFDQMVPVAASARERGRLHKRGPVVGRQNHYGSRSERGTQVVAIRQRLIEIAQHYGVPEQIYLRKAAEHALLNHDSTLIPHALPV